MAPPARPLILTLALDGASFSRLDGLRRRYFPPERNQVPAHVTLFHALPGEEERRIVEELAAICRMTKAFDLQATGYRSLGRGVALALSSPALVQLRQGLAREWAEWLTTQDSAKIAPHVTIQNKVDPATARATHAELQVGFAPFAIRAEGLILWRYLGGPWERIRTFTFGG